MHRTTGDLVDACPYCGVLHGGACPLVKAVDYYQDGSVKRVEFWPSAIKELAGPITTKFEFKKDTT